jgi:hypothetical protein
MTLQSTLALVVQALDAVGIPHMVAGSVASTHHSQPRTTQDIDLVIEADVAQLTRFVQQFDPDRYYVSDPLAAVRGSGQFNLLDPASGWKVDLILRRDRPFSRSEFHRRQSVEILGVRTAVATAEDTILAKLEWSRLGESERQRRDVASILSSQLPDLDLSYLRHWAAELGLGDDLEVALSAAGPPGAPDPPERR